MQPSSHEPSEPMSIAGAGQQETTVVQLIWGRLAAYDDAAKRLRRNQGHLELTILGLGVLVTALAILQNQLGDDGSGTWWDDTLRTILILFPVATSVLIATAASIAPGRRWVQLRTAAESIRRELFLWRTRTGPYEPASPADASVEALLARVEEIEIRLVHSEAGNTTLPTIDPTEAVQRAGGDPADDGVSPLDPDGYFRFRIDDQLAYYRSRVARLRRRIGILRVVAITVGGIGTLLAVTGYEVWIGVSAAVGSAVAAYLGRAQLETTLSAYNEAIASLEVIRTRWLAVPAGSHTHADFADLVARAERVFETEQSTWARHLSEAVDKPFQS